MSRALATIVNGWNVRGVNLEIDAEILSHMASNTRRRNLVEAFLKLGGRRVSTNK